MEIRNQELYQKIEDYINDVYGHYKKYGETIWYGRASFSVKMLAECSYETCQRYPEKSYKEIVDMTFDYLCS